MVTKYKSTKEKRKARVRKNIMGTAQKPRVSVFRSNKFVYAQAIDDFKSNTIAAVSTDKKAEKAFEAGGTLAKTLQKLKVKQIVFDRGPYAYHGIVKRLAEGLRENGINF